MVIFARFCPRTNFFSEFKLIGDGQEIHMRKYLKTVDFINTKNNIFKSKTFLPPRKSSTHTKLYDLENQGQGHYPLMTPENYCMNH